MLVVPRATEVAEVEHLAARGESPAVTQLLDGLDRFVVGVVPAAVDLRAAMAGNLVDKGSKGLSGSSPHQTCHLVEGRLYCEVGPDF